MFKGLNMRRKVVKHGPSTFIISLPARWVKKYGVNKGDELEISEHDNNLIIGSEIKSEIMSGELNLSGLDRTNIMYAIRGFYRLGYDELHLRFDKPTAFYQRLNKNLNITSIIHTEVNRLVGYEIIQEHEKSCVIKDLQETSGKDFDTVLRRIFLLLNDASKQLITGIKNNDHELLETIEEKHNTITKFVSYCMRMLNKKSQFSSQKTSYYYHIIACLDRITDIIKYAARDVLKYDKKLNTKVIHILEGVTSDLNKYYQFFYKYDSEKMREINDNRYKTEIELRNLPSTIKTDEIIMASNMFHILEILLDLVEARSALEY